MRYKYQGFFKSGNGTVVGSGTVSVYLAGTTTPASIYTSATSTTAVNSVTTASNGSYSFFTDAFDYDYSKNYKITMSKTGYNSQTYDYIKQGEPVLGTYTLTADKTVTTALNVPKGVIYDGAYTLTINGSLTAGSYEIFGSSITVAFADMAIKERMAVWFNGNTSSITAMADSATPSVAKLGRFVLTGGTTTITNITGGIKGLNLTIMAVHSLTITDGTNMFLSGSANFAMVSGDTLTLIYNGSYWYETSRGDN